LILNFDLCGGQSTALSFNGFVLNGFVLNGFVLNGFVLNGFVLSGLCPRPALRTQDAGCYPELKSP
jgi:hypothetical protein